MKSLLSTRRRSGILAHISSLPSKFGIGDIGISANQFLDFLVDSGQSCWQFLPVNPTNQLFDNSPYMSSAALAGSSLLICPELLYQDGLISRSSLNDHPEFSQYTTDYNAVQQFKSQLLAEAFRNISHNTDKKFSIFIKTHSWLEDYALFMALKEHFSEKGWFDWPTEIRTRQKESLEKYSEQLADRIRYFMFEQYIFHIQWSNLRNHAKERDILLFGDIPIYVGLDSVDVWANQEIFVLDSSTSLPIVVSGVPPDYFSETGQRWGNPLYRWNSASLSVQKQLLDWWVLRFSSMFELVDVARIDHFRAFESYWAIPAENETAIDGEWLPGPGASFFKKVSNQLGQLDIVAEDLGIITKEVLQLRDELGFPGMKVLQFAFDGNPNNIFLPHNFETTNCVVYTGTHDNDTTVGWFLGERLDDNLRDIIKHCSNRHLHDSSPIHQDLIYLALSSTSNLAILPLQDVLGFGNDCKMNSPGVPEGNWRWRCAPDYLTQDISTYLKSQTALFGRYRDGDDDHL